MTHFMRNPRLRSIWATAFLFALFASQASAFASPDITLYNHSRDGSPIIPLINSALKTLDIEIYQMGSPAVQGALLKAANDGVSVRILIEPTPVGAFCDVFGNALHQPSTGPTDPTCSALKRFKANFERLGGQFRPFNKALCDAGSAGGTSSGTGLCFQHGKIAIADRSDAILSTGNFDSTSLCDPSENPTHCNRDFTVSVRTPPVVDNLQTIFDRDWIGAPYDLPRSLPVDAFNSLTVSPFAIPSITGFIHSARRSIEIEEQYLNDPTMNAALIDAANHKVAVKILASSFCAFGKPDEYDTNRDTTIYTAFEAAGAQIMTFPSAILINGKPGYLHSKAIIVDGRRAWVGSVNGSTTSLTHNREYGIFFDDPASVAKLRASFMTDFRNRKAETWRNSLACKNDLYPL